MQNIPINYIVENWQELARKFPLICVFDVDNHENAIQFVVDNACQFDANIVCCNDDFPQTFFEKLQQKCLDLEINNVIFVGSKQTDVQQKVSGFKELIRENLGTSHLVYVKGTANITENVRYKLYQQIADVKNPFQHELYLNSNIEIDLNNWSILTTWIYELGKET